MRRDDIDARLLAAYAAGDPAEVARLYRAAADVTQDRSEQAFFLTQAYVFALETGAPEAAGLRAALVALNAET